MLIKYGARLVLLVVVLGTIGCDRVTKHVATVSLAGRPTQSFLADTVRLTYAENTGGFLSVGEDLSPSARTALFTVGTGLILALAVWFASRRRWTLWQSVALALFIGGGLSNWIDRLLHGRVVDFLNVGIGSLRTGIFNLADVAILVAAAMVWLPDLWSRNKRPVQ
jgi:signal peptidase II